MLTSEDIQAAVAVYQARRRLSRQSLADNAEMSLKALDSRLRRCGEDKGTLWMLLDLADTFQIPASELLQEAESISQKEKSNAK